jgi:tripartite-type tricarboxylate transporter receptor subunit TctC
MLACAALLFGVSASAQEFPSRPVRLIIPFASGGPTDINARKVAERAEREFGQAVVVENKPGGNTMIGIEYVAHASADGYTLLWATPTFSTGPQLFGAQYDPLRDFAPVTLVGTTTHVLVVNPSVPASTVAELVRYLKTAGSRTNYASVGIGSTTQLEGETFKLMAGVDMQHVPYKGSAPAIVDLVAGRVQVFFDGVGAELPYIADGRVRAIATAGARRATALPNLPTIAEAGLPGFEFLIWVGILAPAAAPHAAVERLNRGFVAALHDPAVVKFLASNNNEAAPTTPAEFAAFLKSDVERSVNVIKKAGIKLE